jgi:hypothetical protein
VCFSKEKIRANCKGPHQASSLECPFIAKAIEIEKVRATGLSYVQAVEKVDEISLLQTRDSNVDSNSHAHATYAKAASCSPLVALSSRIITADVHRSQGTSSSLSSSSLVTRNQTKNQSGLESAQTCTETLNRDNSSNAGLRKIIQEELSSSEK